MDELGLGVQKRAHAGDVSGGGRIVDRVIGRCWPGPPAPDACVFEQPGNSLVAAVAGGGYGIRTVEFRVRVCVAINQYPHRFEVPSARSEMDRLRIPGNVGIALKKSPQRGHVTANGRANRVPNIASTTSARPIGAFRPELVWLDHAHRNLHKRIPSQSERPRGRAHPRPSATEHDYTPCGWSLVLSPWSLVQRRGLTSKKA